MSFMASLLLKPTATAALRPFLRASVNAVRGHLFGGNDGGEGRERRNPSIDWKARLAADVERRRTSFEIEQYRRRRAAALKGRGRA